MDYQEYFDEIRSIDPTLSAKEINDYYNAKYPPAPEYTASEKLSDTGVALTKGAVNLPKFIYDITDKLSGGELEKATALGERFTNTQKILDSFYSQPMQAAKQEVGQAVGVMDTLKSLSPEYVLATGAETLTSALLGTGGVKLATKAIQLLTNNAKALSAAGTAGTIGANVAMEAGSNYSQLKEVGRNLTDEDWAGSEPYKKLVDSGVSPNEAKSQIIEEMAQRGSNISIPAIVAAAFAGRKLDKSLAGGKDLTTAWKGLKSGLVGEASQEAIESGSGQWGSNVATKEFIDPTQSEWEDVPKSSVIGAVIGGPMGGTMGGISGALTRTESPIDKAEATNAKVAETGVFETETTEQPETTVDNLVQPTIPQTTGDTLSPQASVFDTTAVDTNTVPVGTDVTETPIDITATPEEDVANPKMEQLLTPEQEAEANQRLIQSSKEKQGLVESTVVPTASDLKTTKKKRAIAKKATQATEQLKEAVANEDVKAVEKATAAIEDAKLDAEILNQEETEATKKKAEEEQKDTEAQLDMPFKTWVEKAGDKAYKAIKPIFADKEVFSTDATARVEALNKKEYTKADLRLVSEALGLKVTGTKKTMVARISDEISSRQDNPDAGKTKATKDYIAKKNYAKFVGSKLKEGATLTEQTENDTLSVVDKKALAEKSRAKVSAVIDKQKAETKQLSDVEMSEEVQSTNTFVGVNRAGNRIYEDNGKRYLLKGSERYLEETEDTRRAVLKTEEELRGETAELSWEDTLSDTGIVDINKNLGNPEYRTEEQQKVVAISIAVEMFSNRRKSGVKTKEEYAKLKEFYSDPANVKEAIGLIKDPSKSAQVSKVVSELAVDYVRGTTEVTEEQLTSDIQKAIDNKLPLASIENLESVIAGEVPKAKVKSIIRDITGLPRITTASLKEYHDDITAKEEDKAAAKAQADLDVKIEAKAQADSEAKLKAEKEAKATKEINLTGKFEYNGDTVTMDDFELSDGVVPVAIDKLGDDVDTGTALGKAIFIELNNRESDKLQETVDNTKESKKFYKGMRTENNVPKKYNRGSYWTEIEELATYYGRLTGIVNTVEATPKKTFDIDAIQEMSSEEKDVIRKAFVEFAGEGYTEETSEILNVLNGNTDFAYPEQIDVDFLMSGGYDSVRFEYEGFETDGKTPQKASSWFMLGDEFQKPADIKPKRTPVQEESLSTVQEIEQVLSKDLRRLNKAFTPTIVQSRGDLESYGIPMDSIGEDVGAFVYEGKSYIIADRNTPEEAKTALRHEVIGHAGVETLTGESFDNLLEHIQNLKSRGNEQVLNIISGLQENYVDTNGNYELDTREEAREIIAHMAEQGIKNSLVRRAINNIRVLLARFGIGNLDKATVRKALADAARLVNDKTTTFTNGVDGELIALKKREPNTVRNDTLTAFAREFYMSADNDEVLAGLEEGYFTERQSRVLRGLMNDSNLGFDTVGQALQFVYDEGTIHTEVSNETRKALRAAGIINLKGEPLANTTRTEGATQTDYSKGGAIVFKKTKRAAKNSGTYESAIDTSNATLTDKAQSKATDIAQGLANFGLGVVPTTPLIEMGTERGISGIDRLNQLRDKVEAEANQKVEEAKLGVLEPMYNLSVNNKKAYDDMVQLMHDATYWNKDMKKSDRFSKLPKEAQEVYVTTENFHKEQREDMLASLETMFEGMNLNTQRKKDVAALMTSIKEGLAKDKVYFPFGRHGTYRLETLNTKDQTVVTFYDTVGKMKLAKEAYKKAGYTHVKSGLIKSYKIAAFETLSQTAYNQAVRVIEADPEATDAAKESLWKVFLENAPKSQLQARTAHRKNVLGASFDMTRTTANRINTDIKSNTNRKYSTEQSDLLKEAQDSIDNMQDSVGAEKILNELKQRLEMPTHRHGLSSTLGSMNFIWHLGFNMSSALVNLTQTAIVSLPVIGSRHGAIRTTSAMNSEMINVLRGNTDKELMTKLKSMKIIDETQAHMLAQLNEGDSESFNPAWEKIMGASAFMFHKAEVLNRTVTAVAAYKLEKSKLTKEGKLSTEAIEKAALDYAHQATMESHFDYSEFGKPRYMRGDITSVLFAFKSYPVNMLTYLARNTLKTLKGDKEARTKLLGTIGVAWLMGGGAAMPAGLNGLYQALFEAVSDMGDDEEDYTDNTVRDVFMNGLLSTILDTQLASRMSLNDLAIRTPTASEKAESWTDATIDTALGPVGSIVRNWAKAYDDYGSEKYSAMFDKASPLILKNLKNAVEDYSQGYSKTAYDTKLADFEELDALKRFIGFTNLDQANVRAFRSEVYNERRKRTLERKKVLRNFNIAKFSYNTKELAEARAGIAEFNRKYPDERISRRTTRFSYQRFMDKQEGIID